MKRSIVIMMLALAASVFSLTSCNKQNAEYGYLMADYDFFVSDFDLDVYDYTVTYTDVKTGNEVTKPITEFNWIYKEVKKVDKSPSPFVLKIEGKLKPNAEQIIEEMMHIGYVSRSHGYAWTGSASIFEDAECTVTKKNILSSQNNFMVSLAPDQFKQVLNHPTVNVVDICK